MGSRLVIEGINNLQIKVTDGGSQDNSITFQGIISVCVLRMTRTKGTRIHGARESKLFVL